jgi:(E)-4-hydroxy-3-methylbut-2-enyl-diphosphate synthase
MTSTPTEDAKATLAQIAELEAAGCELVRVAVSNRKELEAFPRIREGTALPLIADIQHNHLLAIQCLRLGADKVRINPGTIGGEANYRAVLEEAGAGGKAVRVGINGGSLEADLLERFGWPTPEALAASALRALETADRMGFQDVVVSVKSSRVAECVRAYREVARQTDCPLHLGITEAGGVLTGAVKSAVGLGILLAEGVGETIRVSLTGPPVAEVKVAYDILRALELRRRGPDIISCPTCSRCRMDILSIARQVEERLAGMVEPITVAVMGCYVNGPGEARDADVGLAGGPGKGALFRKGKVVREVGEAECVQALVDEVANVLHERGEG